MYSKVRDDTNFTELKQELVLWFMNSGFTVHSVVIDCRNYFTISIAN